MRIQKQWAFLLGVVTVGLALGCNGGAGGTTQKSTGATTAPPATAAPTTSSSTVAPTVTKTVTNGTVSRFLYSANSGGTGIQQFAIDPKTGALTTVGAQTTTNDSTGAPATPWTIASSPNGKFLYVLLLSNDISSFAVDPTTGVPTQIAGQTVTMGTDAWNLCVDPTNSFVLVTDGASDTLYSYKIGANGGLTNANSAIATSGSSLHDVVVDPSGKFAYATGSGLGNVTVFTIEAGTGNLAKVSEAMAGAGARPICMDPAGKFVFVGNNSDNTVSVFSRDAGTGALTQVGTNLATSGDSYGVSTDPTGKNLYVACNTSNVIDVFSIGATGALTANPAPAAAAGDWPIQITLDASGSFAFAPDYGSSPGDCVSCFTVDKTTGALTANGTPASAGTGSGPHGIALIK